MSLVPIEPVEHLVGVHSELSAEMAEQVLANDGADVVVHVWVLPCLPFSGNLSKEAAASHRLLGDRMKDVDALFGAPVLLDQVIAELSERG